MSDARHLSIVRHFEACLANHGDTHLGVDWPKAEDVPTRHRVMLDVVRAEDAGRPLRLLDFGCGASHLYEYIREQGITNLDYAGLDLSAKFIALSRRKFPDTTYWCLDLLESDTELPRFDYVVANGVFTEKCDLSFEEMLAYFERMIPRLFALADRGVAFNVMSTHVDWERDDLFHLPLDTLAAFLTREVTRNFVVRNDYGLYEYTAYLYR